MESLVGVVIGVVLWGALGSIGSGWWYAYEQGNLAARFPELAEEDKRENLGIALMFGWLLGPIFIPVAFLSTGLGKHGWSLSLKARHKGATASLQPPASVDLLEQEIERAERMLSERR